MTHAVTVGFLPLVDAALLVVAREEGFAEREGIDLRLVREGSWAAVRDKLAVGLFDAAHMLAPAVIASRLGLGQLRAPLVSPVGLSMNGNAITVSRALATALQARIGTRSGPVNPARTAATIGDLAAARARRGEAPLVAAVVFTHSCHLYLMRRWLLAGGVDPDRAIETVVLPPPLMAEGLRSGGIDLFCAGAPWNLAAQAAGAGQVLHAGRDIIADCPEKWLALHATRQHDPWVEPLVRAIIRAARFVADPAHVPLVARHLARPDYLAQPATLIESVLHGRSASLFDPGGEEAAADYIRLDEEAIAPDPARARFVGELMREAGQVGRAEEALESLDAMLLTSLHARATSAL